MLMKQSPFKCSEQFLKITGSTFLPLPACDSTLGWMVYFCNCNKRAGKARGQQAGPSSPFSLLPLLRHQSLCFLNALTWHWATPCGGTGGSDIFEDEVLKSGTNFSTATGRDFPCKAMNMIAISHCSHHAGFPSSFCVWPCLTDSPSSDPAQESVSASA